jgi:hypothetical protein
MLFSPYQIVVMLLEVMSAEDIYAAGGPHPRVQSRLKQNPNREVRDMLSLVLTLVRHQLWPFDEFFVQPLMRLYELEDRGEIVTIEREFAALYEMANHVIDANLVAVASPTRKGALFFAAKYLAAFYKAKTKKYADVKVQYLERSSELFQMLINEMRNDRDSCALLIKGIAAANLVVNRWNVASASQRYSKEMREYIGQSGYLVWAAQQMHRFPKIDKPAFNSLAIASGFCMRRHYPKLRRALEAAGTKFRSYPEFADHDFDDFRAWEATNPPMKPTGRGGKTVKPTGNGGKTMKPTSKAGKTKPAGHRPGPKSKRP